MIFAVFVAYKLHEHCNWDRHAVRLSHFRVPSGEDLFHGQLASVHRGDPLDETLESFCLCDNGTSNTCGRAAVSDTTADQYEPNFHLRLGVPLPIVGRRRKRQTNEALLHDDWRLYQTSYR